MNGLDGGGQPDAAARIEAEVVRDRHAGEHVAPGLDGAGKRGDVVREGVSGPVGRGLVERGDDGGQRQADGAVLPLLLRVGGPVAGPLLPPLLVRPAGRVAAAGRRGSGSWSFRLLVRCDWLGRPGPEGPRRVELEAEEGKGSVTAAKLVVPTRVNRAPQPHTRVAPAPARRPSNTVTSA